MDQFPNRIRRCSVPFIFIILPQTPRRFKFRLPGAPRCFHKNHMEFPRFFYRIFSFFWKSGATMNAYPAQYAPIIRKGEKRMIEVSHLTKRYGDHTAVSDLSFTVPDGQIYGFLGPNGAGKSTTMNIMTGCLAATAGSVVIDGHDIFDEPLAAKQRVGYLPEIPPLYTEMTPAEYLHFVGRAKGLSGEKLKSEVGRVCRRTDIVPVQSRLIRHLSKGYRQRVGLAQAMLGDPSIIILDEPTVGLDPAQIIEIRQLIRDLGQEHTVLLSSHILPEVQAVCGHILILSHGKLVASDTPDNLERLFAGQTTVRLTADGRADEADAVLRGIAGIRYTLEPGETARAVVTADDPQAGPDELCRRLFFAFAGAQLPILALAADRASLEDVFLELTQDGGSSPAGAQAPALRAQDVVGPGGESLAGGDSLPQGDEAAEASAADAPAGGDAGRQTPAAPAEGGDEA